MLKELLNQISTDTLEVILNEIEEKLIRCEAQMIITANPEIFMWAKREKKIRELFEEKNVKIVADGIGVVKAYQLLLKRGISRVAGVDIVNGLLKIADRNNFSLYVYGSKQETLDIFRSKLLEEFSGIDIKKLRNGYENAPLEVCNEIMTLKPDIVLVALGVPKQELFIKSYLFPLKQGIYIGVGGSIDSITGKFKRAPTFYIKHNIEWFYRICKEPKRFKRFCENNIVFAFECFCEKIRSFKRNENGKENNHIRF